MKEKKIIIIEGADATGKTSLCQHIQTKLANGKCHIIHSNFNKDLPKDNHRRQHKLITDFVVKQFDEKHYTGNNFVILDRNYISDIVYGLIGYGSGGTYNQKLKFLRKLVHKLKKIKDARVILIYCEIAHKHFNPDAKEELLTVDEDKKIDSLYHNVLREDVIPIYESENAEVYVFDYTQDLHYLGIDEFIME